MQSVLINTVNLFFEVLNLMIFVRVMLSWFRYNPYNKLIVLLFQLTDPILEPFKKLVSRFGIDTGMMDFSPLIAMLVLYYPVRYVIVYIIYLLF